MIVGIAHGVCLLLLAETPIGLCDSSLGTRRHDAAVPSRFTLALCPVRVCYFPGDYIFECSTLREAKRVHSSIMARDL